MATQGAVMDRVRNHFAEDWHLFPTLRGYRREWIGRDLLAGLTFGAVTMPGQLATAHLAGMPPITGLYGFMFATIVAAVISTNRHLALGVDSTVAPILAAGLAALGAVSETPNYIGLAALTAGIVGIFTLTIGAGRMGWVGDFLSRPVMIGFFGGIAVIIIVNQLPGLLGIQGGRGKTISRIGQIVEQLDKVNVPSLILGLVCVTLLLGIVKINPKIPGALIVLTLSTLSMTVFKLQDDGVKVLGPLKRGLPAFDMPPLSLESIEAVFTTAVIIATLCLAQTAATSRSAANLGGFETDINADFRALGVANIVSSLFGSFTINASPPSTTIIAESRAKSQLPSLVAAGMAIIVLFFSQIIENLPMTTLAAVLIYIAIRIFRVDQMRATLHYSRRAFTLMLIALIGTVVFGIVDGVLFAVMVSFIYQASRTARPELLQLGRSEQGTWLTLTDERAVAVPGVAVFALNGPLWFGNASWFRMRLIGAIPTEEERPGAKPDLLVLDARRIDDIDFTGAEALSDVATIANLRNVQFAVVVQEGRTQRAFHDGGFAELLGRSQFFDTIPLAIAAYPHLVESVAPQADSQQGQRADQGVEGHPPAQT